MKREFDVLCLGMMVYDMLIRPVDRSVFDRDTTMVEPLVCASGGDAMTQAIVSARLGARTGLISKVGDDASGRALMEVLEKNGVCRGHVKISPDVDTAVTLALVQADGSRSFLSTPGLNNATLCLEDFDVGLLKKTRLLGYGSMLFMRALDASAGREVFSRARGWGVETIVDCAHDSYGMGAKVVLEALEHVSIFAPSRAEARMLTGCDDPAEMAESLYARGCGAVVVKLGAEGVYVRSRDLRERIPAFEGVSVVDTTGAGDNFVGGLLAARAEDMPLREAVRFAQAVSAISIGAVGATTALRDRNQVDGFLASYGMGG